MDWTTNRDGKKYQGEIAASKDARRPTLIFPVTPYPKKKTAITVNVPRMAWGRRIESSFNPNTEINGKVKYKLSGRG